jgi:3D (Asp-Asp-Asp) domain-containing protein
VTNGDALRAKSLRQVLLPRVLARAALHVVALMLLLGVVSWTAVLTKKARTGLPLANVRTVTTERRDEVVSAPETVEFEATRWVDRAEVPAINNPFAYDATIRWFDGRPIRPARTVIMRVTAYSPDARSCDDSADGLTATLHSVQTNGWKLVAADKKVLPMGSMVSIPGYDQGMVVPVLDVGGKIKGNHLDVLFPTHEQAVAWGSRRLRVTVWEFADGKPAPNPRRLR